MYGDRPGGYICTTIPFVALLGPTAPATRFEKSATRADIFEICGLKGKKLEHIYTQVLSQYKTLQ